MYLKTLGLYDILFHIVVVKIYIEPIYILRYEFLLHILENESSLS